MEPAASAVFSPRACLNCAAPLHGPFCAQCGQQDVAGPMRVREYVADGLNAHFDWVDGKLPRTLWPLLARPGFLTREFTGGRRVRYVLPWRVYFLVSVAFFFLVDRFDPVTLQSFGGSGIDPQLAARMNGSMAGVLPLLLLGVVPAFTLGVWVVNLGRQPYFTEHLAFAFHFFAFVFLAFAVPVVSNSNLAWDAAFLWIFVYLVLALRRAYDERLAWAAAKAVALYTWFWVLLGFYFLFVVLVAAIRVALA